MLLWGTPGLSPPSWARHGLCRLTPITAAAELFTAELRLHVFTLHLLCLQYSPKNILD